MKNEILNNWEAKIVALLLAITLWFLIKKHVGPTFPTDNARFNRPNVNQQ